MDKARGAVQLVRSARLRPLEAVGLMGLGATLWIAAATATAPYGISTLVGWAVVVIGVGLMIVGGWLGAFWLRENWPQSTHRQRIERVSPTGNSQAFIDRSAIDAAPRIVESQTSTGTPLALTEMHELARELKSRDPWWNEPSSVTPAFLSDLYKKHALAQADALMDAHAGKRIPHRAVVDGIARSENGWTAVFRGTPKVSAVFLQRPSLRKGHVASIVGKVNRVDAHSVELIEATISAEKETGGPR